MYNRVIIVVIFCVLVLSSPYLGDVYGVEYLTDGTLYSPSSLVKKKYIGSALIRKEERFYHPHSR